MIRLLLLFLIGASVTIAAAAEPLSANWVPSGIPPAPTNGPALCQRAYLTTNQAQDVLAQALKRFPNRDAWDAYARHLRERIQAGANLSPLPRRTPLNPIVRAKRTFDGYSVENVAFESVPGYFVTGNLYRPFNGSAPVPAILCTHGHTKWNEKPDDYDQFSRFSSAMQTRCATLARMG